MLLLLLLSYVELLNYFILLIIDSTYSSSYYIAVKIKHKCCENVRRSKPSLVDLNMVVFLFEKDTTKWN